MFDYEINKLRTVESKSFLSLSQIPVIENKYQATIHSENIVTGEDMVKISLSPVKLPESKISMNQNAEKFKVKKLSSEDHKMAGSPIKFDKVYESNKEIALVKPKLLDITQDIDISSIIAQLETPEISGREEKRPLSPKNSIKTPRTQKQNKGILKVLCEMMVLLLIFLVHVISIAIITGFLSFYRYENSLLRYLDNIFDGIFLGIISIALNLDLIYKQYQGEDKKVLAKQMSFSYLLIIICSILICVYLDRLEIMLNEYWIILIQIIALFSASIIYIIFSALVKKYRQRTKNHHMTISDVFLGIKNVFFSQLMIIYPFFQLMISVSYGRAFHNVSELHISDWVLFGICITYPISIGISKWLMEKTSKKTNLQMKFYIEYISIAFAALPFRTLYFDITAYDRLAIVLFTKFVYKTFYYVLVAVKVKDINNFIVQFFLRVHRRVGKTGTKFLKKITENVIDLQPSSQIDIDIKEDPLYVDFGMKFILLMFSDIFSTIAMIIIVLLFNGLKENFFGTASAVEIYVKCSAIDLGLDMLFLIFVTCLWRFSKSGLRKLDLFELGEKFFKRYYLVFIASNFNLFHTLFYILSLLLTLK